MTQLVSIWCAVRRPVFATFHDGKPLEPLLSTKTSKQYNTKHQVAVKTLMHGHGPEQGDRRRGSGASDNVDNGNVVVGPSGRANGIRVGNDGACGDTGGCTDDTGSCGGDTGSCGGDDKGSRSPKSEMHTLVQPIPDPPPSPREHLYFSADVTLLADTWPGIEHDLHPMAPLLLNRTGLQVNVWLGRAGVVTATHYDSTWNFFVQLRGKKRFVLAPPGTPGYQECVVLRLFARQACRSLNSINTTNSTTRTIASIPPTASIPSTASITSIASVASIVSVARGAHLEMCSAGSP
jgi:hypothetical protein